jgi:O-acetylhomoserine/O-acetylserine sulfhydrylase-like pyridoxal-dependent enzyme
LTGIQAVLEERMAALEGGVAGVATASGQAAQLMTLLELCNAGQNVLASQNGLFGGVRFSSVIIFQLYV